MFKLKSLDSFEVKDRGTAHVVESPVSAERTFKAMRAAMGPEVEIDGVVVKPIGYETVMLGRPVRVGETISVLVSSDEPNHPKAA